MNSEYIFIKPNPWNDTLKIRITVWSQCYVIFKFHLRQCDIKILITSYSLQGLYNKNSSELKQSSNIA